MNMLDGKRFSPIKFSSQPAETEIRGGCEVVLSYGREGQGPFLVDLSHRPKWDLEGGNIDIVKPWGQGVPANAGQCKLVDGFLINRMNRTQAAIWDLAAEDLKLPKEICYTDVTDGLCLLALVGAEALAVMEKVSPLDLASPGKTAPYLVQGPVMHIPCQLVVLDKGDNMTVLISFSRGYGQAMVEALLDAGSEYGLRPGGERVFRQRLKAIGG